MMSNPTVTVVGGGLAGLVAARHLAGGGADVTLYERRDDLGGRVRTLERDGYRFDRGFQVLFTAYPAVDRELDLEALDLRRFAPGAVIAKPGHRSTLSNPLRNPRALLASTLNTDVTLGDKLRVLNLRRELAATDLETIFSGEDYSTAEYLRERGFSEKFIQNFAAPFYGGITLDRSLSTSKRVFEYTFKTLSAGDIAVPGAGMGAIPRQLATSARSEGATIDTGVTVTAVSSGVSSDGDDGKPSVTVNGDRRTADAVVVATDPPTAAQLTGVKSVPTTARSCVTQYYALSADATLDSGRRLVLNAGDVGPNQIVPHSEVAPEYAPDDATLISATYLGEPTATDEALAEEAAETLASWYPARLFGELELLYTERLPFAQFAQPPGIHDRLPDTRAPDGRVYLAGDYTQWSSIQGAMESGRRAAKAVVDDRS